MAIEQQLESLEQGRSRFTPQSLSDLALVPYAQVNGQWTLPDHALIGIAQQMMREGSFHRVFYEGHIHTPEDFLQTMKRPANVPVFVFRGLEPIGFGWLNGAIGKRAFAHFCVLKTAWGKDSVQAGKLVVRYWMSFESDGEPVFDVLIGVIPERNERAIDYAQRVGFTKLGMIPGMAVYQGDRVASAILYFSRFPYV